VSDKVAYCYERANECRLKAEETLNEAFRQEYLDMEDRWLLLARSYEFGDRLVDFTNETARRRSQVIASDAQHPSIPRVTCPECGKRMRLATIEALGKGPSDNKATYVCQCSFTYEIAIKRQS
jgi:hypothetical protein